MPGAVGHRVVIGYGDAMGGDDGAGYIAAELLRERIRMLPDVEVLSVYQLTPELMQPIARAKEVSFIGAALAGQAGTYRRVALKPVPTGSRSTRLVTPESL